jgi:PAS domain S-box-containing protein
VPVGRASVIVYDRVAGTGTLRAVDEDHPLAAGAGTVFPIDQIVPAELLARPATRVYPDMAVSLSEVTAARLMVSLGYRAACWSPMIAGGALVGMLAMVATDPAVLEGDAPEIATEIAGQLAIALRAERDRDAAASASARLALLHVIDRAILDADTVTDLATTCAPLVAGLLGSDRVVVARYEPSRGVGRRLASTLAGECTEGPGEPVPLDRLLSSAMLERPHTVVMPDLAVAAPTEPGARFMVEAGLRAGVFVPLVAHGRLQGGLIVGWRNPAHLTDERVAIAGEVADQLAVAILHADAHEAIARSARRLELIHEIDQAILASESPEELAARVAEPLARLAGARRLDIATYNLDRDEGRVLAFVHDGTHEGPSPVGRTFSLRAIVPMVSIEHPTTMGFDDIRRSSGDAGMVRAAVAAGLNHGAWIPLVAGDRLLGAIGMASDDPGMAGPEVLDLARAMGDQLAVALQHAADREQLAERERRLSAILEASPNGILVVDPGGVVRYANRAAARQFGAGQTTLVGVVHASLVPPLAAEAHPAWLASWFADPDALGTHPLDTEAARLDGTTFPVHVLLASIDTESGPMAIATVVDLSERSALEARLRQAERLETLGQFAGILAHDVRNYLTAVAWSADILAADLPPGSPHGEDVALIRKATQDAIDMSRTVLEFARPTGDPRGRVNVGEHLAGTRPMLARIVGPGIALVIEAEPGLPPAGIDPTAFTQVLGNLATNAREAMPEGGTLRLTVRPHEITSLAAEAGLAGPGRYVRILVADTGVGMDEDTRRRAFEAFYTTKTMASTARGTGLGLSSVFLIVTKAGGFISITSAPGKGTTFTIDLPAVD